MALERKQTNVAPASQPATVWKKLMIPDSKLKIVWTDAKTKKTSMGFEVAESTGCKGIFYVAVSLVKRNADATGFIVSMPEKATTVSERDGKGGYNRFTAEHLSDLGYPVEE